MKQAVHKPSLSLPSALQRQPARLSLLAQSAAMTLRPS